MNEELITCSIALLAAAMASSRHCRLATLCRSVLLIVNALVTHHCDQREHDQSDDEVPRRAARDGVRRTESWRLPSAGDVVQAHAAGEKMTLVVIVRRRDEILGGARAISGGLTKTVRPGVDVAVGGVAAACKHVDLYGDDVG